MKLLRKVLVVTASISMLNGCFLFHKKTEVNHIYHVTVGYENAAWRICHDNDCPQRTHKSILIFSDQQPMPPLPVFVEPPHMQKITASAWDAEHAIVHFKTGQSVAYNHHELIEILRQLRAYGSHQTLILNGYTDNRGSLHLNNKLAHSRAVFIAKWLRLQGVLNPMIIQGKGLCCYAMSNSLDKNRAMNRRAVVVISTEGGGIRDSKK